MSLQFCSSKAWDTQAEVLTPSQQRRTLLSSLYNTSQFRNVVKTCEKQGKCLLCLNQEFSTCKLTQHPKPDAHGQSVKLGHSADPLEFGRDLNAARFKDGVRETPNAQARHPLLLMAENHSASASASKCLPYAACCIVTYTQPIGVWHAVFSTQHT